jgi:hypothetical protein
MYALQYLGAGDFKAANAYHARACDKDLVIGEVLTWEHVKERSLKSHSHYFAAVHDAWLNLPESISVEFPSSESLRKYCLIKAGYCTIKKVACSGNNAANELTAFMLELDSYLICKVNHNVATIYRAQSQSYKAMGKKVFQESKDAVLEILSEMIGAEIKEHAA